MDSRSDIREFLAGRRARLTPEQAGLTVYGRNRRVTGLRREEVALLAGVSVEYYTRLERGNLKGVSDSVLEALARALQLDDAERTHLFDLARAASGSGRPGGPGGASSGRRRGPARPVRPGLQRMLDAMTQAPAWVRNGRADVLATNRLGRALYAPLFEAGASALGSSPARQPANTARFAFLDPRGRDFYVDWETTARDMVGVLRAEAGRDPYDRGLTELVGELSTRSEEFRQLWAEHGVHIHRTGTKRLQHPVVGLLEMTYEVLQLPADPGLMVIVYTAEPNTPTADALSMLASWAATQDLTETVPQQ
jgi:transcriptional regulator with XRE-family HTH domain